MHNTSGIAEILPPATWRLGNYTCETDWTWQRTAAFMVPNATDMNEWCQRATTRLMLNEIYVRMDKPLTKTAGTIAIAWILGCHARTLCAPETKLRSTDTSRHRSLSLSGLNADDPALRRSPARRAIHMTFRSPKTYANMPLPTRSQHHGSRDHQATRPQTAAATFQIWPATALPPNHQKRICFQWAGDGLNG